MWMPAPWTVSKCVDACTLDGKQIYCISDVQFEVTVVNYVVKPLDHAAF